MTFTPPTDWLEFRTIDAHTAGEPLRVILSGMPEPAGATMLEKRSFARTHHDRLRRALMLEPRGHADMYGCLPTRAVTPDGDLGVLFLHNEGYSTMCGHGIIAIVTVGLDCGLFQARDGLVRIDTPAGRVTARPWLEGGRVARVSFENVPSFLLERDFSVEVDGFGRVSADVAFGGAFYAYVDATKLGLDPREARALIDAGMKIKRAVANNLTLKHPSGDAELEFLYGTIFTWPAVGELHSTHVCVFADGEVDRSPTGTGVSGRAAILYARGELERGRSVRIESIVRSCFDVKVVADTRLGGISAVIPEVTGSAYITGQHTFWIDPRDPFAEGFLLR